MCYIYIAASTYERRNLELEFEKGHKCMRDLLSFSQGD